MNEQLDRLEKEIKTLKQRNERVEADKAWETSTFRIVTIMIATYIIAAIAMYVIGARNSLTSALIPVIGYFLSTQSLPYLKKWWLKRTS